MPENSRKTVAISTPLTWWAPLTAQAATIDGFPSVASYYSLGRRLHHSVLVKHGNCIGFAKAYPGFEGKWGVRDVMLG